MTAALAPTTTPDQSSRVGWIDGARGLSIAAMIASHVEYVIGPGWDWFHLYLMRPVAPMFLLLLGMLWRPGWRDRHWQLVSGALVASVLGYSLGFAVPNILPLILLAVGVLHVGTRWPIATLIVAVNQPIFWPMPDWWTGYDPGFVVAFAVIGAVVPADGVLHAYGRLGSRLGLETIGRQPLRWYLGHLLALWVLVIAMQIT